MTVVLGSRLTEHSGYLETIGHGLEAATSTVKGQLGVCRRG